ncbi:hypothetical protein HII28_16990 [Planctomonas sp. JC2975]|uniref:hypothetical protein n=1 Tax=Planctomonas sp. JC2975 TaxID=2729626 RepID=UPI001472CC68|nr:hypothetical protein [Planctomonas sp. JC2975]NNC13566.1 hypothetical protein [Planctomonas sp. JC2975]
MDTQTLDRPRSVTTETADALTLAAHPPSPVDRLAMRVGLALIVWSRHESRLRRSAAEDWDQASLRNQQTEEREAREQAWLNALHLMPRR